MKKLSDLDLTDEFQKEEYNLTYIQKKQLEGIPFNRMMNNKLRACLIENIKELTKRQDKILNGRNIMDLRGIEIKQFYDLQAINNHLMEFGGIKGKDLNGNP